MQNKNIQIKIYQDEKGIEPFVKWIEGLKDLKTKARIKNRLMRIQLGNIGDKKFIGNGIFELRFHFGSGYRIYFGEIENTLILLLCGGDKGSQTKDIKNAKQFWENFKERRSWKK